MDYRAVEVEAFDYKNAGDVESFKVFLKSPGGDMNLSEAVEVTIPHDLRDRLRKLDRRRLTFQEIIRVGEDLAGLLFPERVRPNLERTKARIGDTQGLRIHLTLDAYELADIPWEYIYMGDQDTPAAQKDSSGFLALDRGVSILRTPKLEQVKTEMAPVPNQALRMIVLLSNPEGTDDLDIKTEQANIDKAVREIRDIAVQYYPDATIGSLEDATINEAHIFHYSGHAKFNVELGSKEGVGFLELTGEFGGKEPFAAVKLASLLRRRGVRLALLGACESSRVDRINAWTGIAPALMRAGIPAVVGMQFSVLDENAIHFSKAFYTVLAAGKSIDEAVSAGRRAISNRTDDEERDWGAPVLYLRAEGDGVLFPRATDKAGETLAIAENKIRGDLKRSFQASLDQIDVVKDHKELHDNLHDLQYWFTLVRGQVSTLLDTKGAVQGLRNQLGFLSGVNTKLRDTFNHKKVAPSEEVWIQVMEKAGADFETALDTPEPNMQLLTDAVEKIGNVLQRQPTLINSSLMRAIGALRIKDLIDIVQRVFDESIVKSSNRDNIERFSQGIEALKGINNDLSSLIKEHDTWQASEGMIAMVRLTLGTPNFPLAWEQVKSSTSSLYSNISEDWATKMKTSETSVDQACKANDVTAATDWFDKFADQGRRRFWNVDKAIKRKCEELAEIRTKMESI